MDALLFYLRSKNWDEIGKPTNDDHRRTDSRSLLRTNAPSNQPTDPSLHRGEGEKMNSQTRNGEKKNSRETKTMILTLILLVEGEEIEARKMVVLSN